MASELNTEISIGAVHLELFKKLVLKDLLVKDQQNDTLLFVPALKVDIRELHFRQRKISFSSIDLVRARIKLQHYKGSEDINFQFIADYFSSSETDTIHARPWRISADNLKLTDITFSMRDQRDTNKAAEGAIDFEDLYLDKVNMHFSEISAMNDSVFTSIKNISFKEKSGFALNHLMAEAKFAPDEMRFNGLILNTPFSSMIANLTFRYNALSDFTHFLTMINFKAGFQQSVLSSRDLAPFVPGISGFNRSIIFSGDMNGTVNKMKAKNLIVHYGNKTFFRGNASIEGLPDLEETFIDLAVNDFFTDKEDIETIPILPFNNQTLTISPEVARLGLIHFKGKFTGFYNDFVAYGNMNTALGSVSSDLNLKLDKAPVYSGRLSAKNFDAGKFWNAEETLGKLTFKAEVNGKYFDAQRITASVKGNIEKLELLQYNYSNIKLNGTVAKKLFHGALTVADENIDLDFSGKIDYSRKVPLFDFKARLENARLAKINLLKRDTSASLSLNTDFYISGNNIDNMHGYTKFKDIHYSENNRELHINEINLTSSAEGMKNNIAITSDIADLNVQGEYRYSSVIKSFLTVIRRHLPNAGRENIKFSEAQNFSYTLTLKNTDSLFAIFIPSLQIIPNTVFTGNFNTHASDFSINFNSENIKYDGFNFSNISFKGNTLRENFETAFTIKDITLENEISLQNFTLAGKAGSDSAFFNLGFTGKDSVSDYLRLQGNADFNGGKTTIQLSSAAILFEGALWNIQKNNSLLIDSSGVEIKNFTFSSGEQELAAEGKISTSTDKSLVINLQKFKLNSLNRLLSLYKVHLGGVANGSINIANVLSDPNITGNLVIREFSYNQDTLGTASIIAGYDAKTKAIEAEATASRGDFKNIGIKGKYFIRKPDDELDFAITLEKTNLQPFGYYLKSFASDLRGYASGDLRLSGMSARPVLTGNLRLQKTSFVVNYLNTRYSFSDNIPVSEYGFDFKNIKIYDENGNSALLKGRIFHDHFKDFGIDIRLDAYKFKCLNTSRKHNEQYYGKAFASGVININGSFDNLNINGTATTEKGTHIFIPLSNSGEVGSVSFISFIVPDTLNARPAAITATDLSGINLDFTFEATPDAEVELVFDEKIGDVMRGSGSGTIKMEIDPFGSFNMYGDYTIQQGDYLFTLQNIINKRFDVERGGTIKWNGSPYNAIIDMNAKYKLRASLFDLLQDTSAAYRKRLDVILTLSLKNRLLNPDISFNINIPYLDPATETRVKKEINSEQDVNTQTLSLLVLNRFSPSKDAPRLGTSGAGVSANASELLSGQLTNWAQQITNAVNIDINYKAGDRLNSDELEVALSTKIFNDRVTLDGIVGVSGENEITQRTSNIVGDFNVDVQVSNNGRFHFKAFNRSNNNSFLNYFNALYTQGIGIFYRQEFDSIEDLFEKQNKSDQYIPEEKTSAN